MKDVQIVVAAGGPDKPLGVEHLEVPLVRSAGEPIDLRYRLDANKLLTVHAALANQRGSHCTVRLENPLCAVAFGSARQREIAELEIDLARAVPEAPKPLETAKRDRLVRLYHEEGKHERAIDEARKQMEADGRPSEYLLNLTAGCYEQLGALDRAEKFYREAIRVAPGSPVGRFNLSLLLETQGPDRRSRRPHGRDGEARARRGRLPRLAGDPEAEAEGPDRDGGAASRRRDARRPAVARRVAALLARPDRPGPGRRRHPGPPRPRTRANPGRARRSTTSRASRVRRERSPGERREEPGRRGRAPRLLDDGALRGEGRRAPPAPGHGRPRPPLPRARHAARAERRPRPGSTSPTPSRTAPTGECCRPS